MHDLERRLLTLADTVEDQRMNHNAIAVVLRAMATRSHDYIPLLWKPEGTRLSGQIRQIQIETSE